MMLLAMALAATSARPDPYSGGVDDPGTPVALASVLKPSPEKEAADLAAARKVFIDHLRDPDRAKVRNFHMITETTDTAHPASYCGEVNAPNAYGGMSGWHRYYVAASGFYAEDGGSYSDRSLLDTLCVAREGSPDLSAAFAPDQSAGR
jgi:hypothetical protein